MAPAASRRSLGSGRIRPFFVARRAFGGDRTRGESADDVLVVDAIPNFSWCRVTGAVGDDQWAEELATMFADFGQALSEADDDQSVFEVLTAIAVRRVAGAEFAGITRARSHGYQSVAITDQVVADADELQYSLGEGPCVGAVEGDGVGLANDLRTDARWPRFGPGVFAATGIVSMLSYRLMLDDDDTGLNAALNLYSTRSAAFNDTSRNTALLLATHGAMAVSRASNRAKAARLELALDRSRDIGVGIGVLMSLHKITRQQAFDLLSITGQNTQRKVVDVARDVARTGALPAPPGHPPEPHVQ